ncbi:hypothetical protein N184_34355 [Sinorhizobium sp. GL28]|nr:hypothetical protein N184_34355 [Sinorhizobium sp. GL28]
MMPNRSGLSIRLKPILVVRQNRTISRPPSNNAIHATRRKIGRLSIMTRGKPTISHQPSRLQVACKIV